MLVFMFFKYYYNFLRMSLRCPIGPESNLIEPDIELESRILLGYQ